MSETKGKEYELQDSYPVSCGKRTTCFCGKATRKGDEAERGVYWPLDGTFGMVWRLGCSTKCLPKTYRSNPKSSMTARRTVSSEDEKSNESGQR